MRTNVAILYTKLGPYHVARLSGYAQLEPGLLAIEVASREERYGFWSSADGNGAFRRTTLFPGALEAVPTRLQLAAAERCLQEHDPGALVVAGYAAPVMRAAAAWARRRNRPVVLMSVSTQGDRFRWRPREWAKRALVRRLYDCAFVAGSRSAAYLRRLGFSEDRIWTGCDVVDNEHFRVGAEAARARRQELRLELGLPDRFFLYVGRLAAEKNLARLLQAYDQYRRRGGAWDLVLVGTGPLAKELRVWAQQQGLAGVHWAGAQSYENLPAYYGLASCLVLPSEREPWGLVVNEAAAAGLPVLVSHACGCVPELVRRGMNGYHFAPWDAGDLARLMLRMSSGETDLAALGEASQRLVSLYTPETWARTLADCVHAVANGHPARPGAPR
jgi:glycosyltransferase involved in cell wall biosynthesis